MPSQLFHKPFTIHLFFMVTGCTKLVMTTPIITVTELLSQFLIFMIIMSFPSFLFWTTTSIKYFFILVSPALTRRSWPSPIECSSHACLYILWLFWWRVRSIFLIYLLLFTCTSNDNLFKKMFPKLSDDLVILRKSAFSSLVPFILCFLLKIHKLVKN